MSTMPEIKASIIPIFAEAYGGGVADSVAVSFNADHDADPSIYMRANMCRFPFRAKHAVASRFDCANCTHPNNDF